MIRSPTVTAALLIAGCLNLYAQPAPPADGFPLPVGAIQRFGNRQLRHPETIIASAVSPDGKYLATLGNSSVVVWDLKTLSARCTLRGPRFGTYGLGERNADLVFYPDSKSLLVSVRPAGRASIAINEVVELAQVWDVETGKVKFSLTGHWNWTSAAWLVKGGKEIALQSGYQETSTIRYFDAKDGKELRSVKLPQAYYGAWVVPAGDRIAIARQGQDGFTVVDCATGSDIYSVIGNQLNQMAMSPDGKRLLCGEVTGKVHVHDVDAKKELFTFQHPAGKQRGPMRFSKDGQTLYFGGQYGQLFRWDLKNNKRLPDIGMHSTWTLTSIALSPDETMLYSMGADRLVERWDLKTGKKLPLPDGYITQTVVAPATDGKSLIIADHGGRVDYWDLATGRHVKQLQGTNYGINCLAVSADGHWLAAGRTVQDVQLFDLTTGKLEKRFGLVEKPDTKGSDHVQRVFFRPDGKVLYTTSGTTGITAWSVPDAKRLWNTGGIGYVAAGDPKGRWIAASIPNNNQVVQWGLVDASNGQVVRRLDVAMEQAKRPQNIQYSPHVTDFTFSPDGDRVLSAHQDGLIRVWDPNSGKLVGKVAGSWVGAAGIACSPDGRWVGVGRSDRKISIFELATGKEVLTLTGHDSPVRAVAFTRDGKGIVGNADLAPVLWSLDPRDPAEAEGPTDRLWATLASEDGAKAYRLVWALAKHPKKAVKLLSERIDAKNLFLPREQFDKWVAALDSPRFRAREVAERNLMQAGLKVPIAWLHKALVDAKGDEVVARLQRVLAQREKPNPSEWRLGRAVQILALAGTDEAKALLKTWADAGGSGLALDAKAALERLP